MTTAARSVRDDQRSVDFTCLLMADAVSSTYSTPSSAEKFYNTTAITPKNAQTPNNNLLNRDTTEARSTDPRAELMERARRGDIHSISFQSQEILSPFLPPLSNFLPVVFRPGAIQKAKPGKKVSATIIAISTNLGIPNR